MRRAITGRQSFTGRGTLSNPDGRFDKQHLEQIDDGWYQDEVPESIPTTLEPDRAREVISTNDSPDVPFEKSINPYRGCSHGCSYCYARPSHAYMGLSPGLDFETRLFYKADAARVLEAQLAQPRYVCKSITLGANTDPYQPVERRMKITRSILKVLASTRHPVSILTKSALVLRDLDLLTDMARDGLASVAVSVTTLDAELKRVMEPRAASPQARLRTLAALSAAGIPTSVMAAPTCGIAALAFSAAPRRRGDAKLFAHVTSVASRSATEMSSWISSQCRPRRLSSTRLRWAGVACSRRGKNVSGTPSVRPSLSSTHMLC